MSKAQPNEYHSLCLVRKCVVNNSNKSYPSNPFDELDKVPDGYTGIGNPDQDGEWVFTGDSYVAHQRNDNTRHKWYYNSNSGEFGARVAY